MVAAVAMGLYQTGLLSGWGATCGVLLWAAKDALLYPFVRGAYQAAAPAGVEGLVGLEGRARQDIAPRGYVHVRGELWLSELAPGSGPVAAGGRVAVVGARGSLLIVREV